MFKNKQKNIVATASFLPYNDPNFPQFQQASQLERDPRAKQLAAQLVATCPRGIRNDPQACTAHLHGVTAEHAITALLDDGKELAKSHLDAAEEAAQQMKLANDELGKVDLLRKELANDPVDAGLYRTTRGENRRHLGQNLAEKAGRELIGDREHQHEPRVGWPGHCTALVAAFIEVIFTMAVFNVSLTALTLKAALPWIGLTLGLVLFNEVVPRWVGNNRRIAREMHDAATRIHTHALAAAHHPEGVQR